MVCGENALLMYFNEVTLFETRTIDMGLSGTLIHSLYRTSREKHFFIYRHAKKKSVVIGLRKNLFAVYLSDFNRL